MMQLKQSSLNRSIFFSLLILSFTTIIGVSSLWIYSEFTLFTKSIRQLEQNFEEQKKFQLQQEVQRAVAYTNFKRAQSEKRLKTNIRNRTYEAFAIATNLYEKNKEILTTNQIGDLIKESLRPIRFNNGRGYYFATRLNGTEELFADKPKLEGTNLLEMQDNTGKFIIKDMISIVKNSHEGFYYYNWTKPGQEEKSFPKIAFIKLFKPLNWFIGTGEYLDDVNQDIQAEVLSWIEQIKFGSDGYIFAGDFKGTSLSGPAKMKNMYHVEDPNGVKIVQELISAARSGGGFVNYVMPQFKGMKNAPKMSYASAINEWQWYVGSGIYIGEIVQVIAAEKEKLHERIQHHLLKVIVSLLLAICVIYLLARFFTITIGKNIEKFSTFFGNAALNYTRIDRKDFGYIEFEELALSANQMIEARNRNEIKLKDSKKWLETILNSVQSGIMVIDADKHIIIDINPEAERLIGGSRDEIIGKRCHNFVCVADEGRCPITTMKQDIINEEKVLQRIDGDKIPIIKTVKLITLHGNRYIIESFIDLSEKKRLEAQLYQAEKFQALGTLSGGIAHDFNNLLMGIQGRTELMMNCVDNVGPQIEHLKCIEEYISSASTLTRQLLGIARGGKYDIKPVDMNQLVRHQGELFIRTKKQITLSGCYAADLWSVEVDQGQIEQVIWNLFINAQQAMPGSGEITIKTENCTIDSALANKLKTAPGNFIQFQMTDNGIGMEQETLRQAFDPFFTTKEKGRGTGLGLASVYGIITNHGGSIKVTSSPGAGTQFSIYLPASDLTPTVSEESLSKTIKGTGVILLIDDEKMIREVGAEMLKMLGYEVLLAANGEEALKIYQLHQELIVLVILDMLMPGMSGRTVFEKLHALNPDIKIVIASGYSLDEEAGHLLNSKSCKFIQKPFSLEALSIVVAKLIPPIIDEAKRQ